MKPKPCPTCGGFQFNPPYSHAEQGCPCPVKLGDGIDACHRKIGHKDPHKYLIRGAWVEAKQ